MKKRTIKFGGIVLVLVGCAYLAIWHNRRPDMPLERLFADNPIFPTQWNAGNAFVIGINWQISEPFAIEEPSLFNTPNATRTWSENGRRDVHFRIKQLIGNYRSPLLAWALDRLFPLDHAHKEEWGNLLSDKFAADRYPIAWSYHSTAAD